MENIKHFGMVIPFLGISALKESINRYIYIYIQAKCSIFLFYWWMKTKYSMGGEGVNTL